MEGMTERQKAAYALYQMADSCQELARKIRDEKPARHDELMRSASLRRDMAQAILNGDDWMRDVDRVHERLVEVYHLNVLIGRKPFPRKYAERYVSLMSEQA